MYQLSLFWISDYCWRTPGWSLNPPERCCLMLVRHLTAVCFCVSEASTSSISHCYDSMQTGFYGWTCFKACYIFEISELCFIPPRFLLVHNETCRYFKLAWVQWSITVHIISAFIVDTNTISLLCGNAVARIDCRHDVSCDGLPNPSKFLCKV